MIDLNNIDGLDEKTLNEGVGTAVTNLFKKMFWGKMTLDAKAFRNGTITKITPAAYVRLAKSLDARQMNANGKPYKGREVRVDGQPMIINKINNLDWMVEEDHLPKMKDGSTPDFDLLDGAWAKIKDWGKFYAHVLHPYGIGAGEIALVNLQYGTKELFYILMKGKAAMKYVSDRTGSMTGNQFINAMRVEDKLKAGGYKEKGEEPEEVELDDEQGLIHLKTFNVPPAFTKSVEFVSANYDEIDGILRAKGFESTAYKKGTIQGQVTYAWNIMQDSEVYGHIQMRVTNRGIELWISNTLTDHLDKNVGVKPTPKESQVLKFKIPSNRKSVTVKTKCVVVINEFFAENNIDDAHEYNDKTKHHGSDIVMSYLFNDNDNMVTITLKNGECTVYDSGENADKEFMLKLANRLKDEFDAEAEQVNKDKADVEAKKKAEAEAKKAADEAAKAKVDDKIVADDAAAKAEAEANKAEAENTRSGETSTDDTDEELEPDSTDDTEDTYKTNRLLVNSFGSTLLMTMVQIQGAFDVHGYFDINELKESTDELTSITDKILDISIAKEIYKIIEDKMSNILFEGDKSLESYKDDIKHYIIRITELANRLSGVKKYILEYGKNGNIEDLVGILDEIRAEINKVGSLDTKLDLIKSGINKIQSFKKVDEDPAQVDTSESDDVNPHNIIESVRRNVDRVKNLLQKVRNSDVVVESLNIIAEIKSSVDVIQSLSVANEISDIIDELMKTRILFENVDDLDSVKDDIAERLIMIESSLEEMVELIDDKFSGENSRYMKFMIGEDGELINDLLKGMKDFKIPSFRTAESAKPDFVDDEYEIVDPSLIKQKSVTPSVEVDEDETPPTKGLPDDFIQQVKDHIMDEHGIGIDDDMREELSNLINDVMKTNPNDKTEFVSKFGDMVDGSIKRGSEVEK